MRHRYLSAVFVGGLAIFVFAAIGQEAPAGRGGGAGAQDRGASTRAFLGLGVAPDKAAAERGAPVFQQNCAFCHGPQARGAEGPNLIVSDVVLGDDHGEHLVPFLKKGRPEKGMPSFASVSDDQLKDISEFLHQQVEDVANRGTYHLTNILVGDAAKGKAYVDANCMSCHKAETFEHIAGKFRAPDQLQRGWVWPTRPADHSLDVTARVKSPEGTFTGRVTQISDFRVTIVDQGGASHVIDRKPGVEVETKDPLDPHQKLLMTLKNDDMHNVTAYLETLK
ncbi:MAG TPA: c-type cytochrome [Granulicella sp.]